MRALLILAALACLLPKGAEASILRIQFSTGLPFEVFEDYSLTPDPFPSASIERIEGVLVVDLSAPASMTQPRYFPGSVRELSVTLYDGFDNILGKGSSFDGTTLVSRSIAGSRDGLTFVGQPLFAPGFGNPSPLSGLGDDLNGIALVFDGAPGILTSSNLADLTAAQMAGFLASGPQESIILLSIDIEPGGSVTFFDQPIGGFITRVSVPLPAGLPLLLAALGLMAGHRCLRRTCPATG